MLKRKRGLPITALRTGKSLTNKGEVQITGNGAAMLDLPSSILIDILSRLPLKDLFRCWCVCRAFLNLLSEHYFLGLPLPIVLDILSRLPLKALFRLRGICRTFLKLISDPYSSNVLFSRQPPTLLLRSSMGRYSFFELGKGYNCKTYIARPIKFKYGFNLPRHYAFRLIFVDSCNGLICFCDCLSAYICNPILREYTKLPEPILRNGTRTVWGFGFSPVTKQYKTIRISVIASENDAEVDIFTLGTDKWRHIGAAPSPSFHVPSYRSSIVPILFNLNGALHWVHAKSICALDLAEEQVRCFPLPFCERPWMELVVLGNCLSVFDHHDSDWLVIWSMKEYGVVESWSKVQVMRPSINLFLNPITSWKSGEIFFTVTSSPRKDSPLFMTFDPQRKRLKRCKIYNTRLDVTAYSYVPSFLTLKDIVKTGSIIYLKKVMD